MYRHMVRERHSIWTQRQIGEPQPWTTDPVLANRKFTNMFRVLDPGSQFVFQLKADDPLDTITRLVFYRITNKPETWYAMKDMLGGRWPVASDFTASHEALLHHLHTYRNVGNKIFSGAYIIIPEPGTTNDKLDGAFRVARRFVQEKSSVFFRATSDAERFLALKSVPGVGKFLAMQILTDWGYLQDEQPNLDFVVAGPGAERGAKALNSDLPAKKVIQDLTLEWTDSPDVRLGSRSLTAMDVQNTLCEFSKYAREVVSPKKTTPYKPAHPGPQSKPVLPAWW